MSHLSDEDKAMLAAAVEQAQAGVRDLFAATYGHPPSMAELAAWKCGYQMGIEAGLEGSMSAVKKLIDDGDLRRDE